MDELLNELYELNLSCLDCDYRLYRFDDSECCDGCSTMRRLSVLRAEIERLEDDLIENYCI